MIVALVQAALLWLTQQQGGGLSGLGIPASVWISIIAAGVGYGVGHGTLRTKADNSKERMDLLEKTVSEIKDQLTLLRESVARIEGQLRPRRDR